MEGAEKEYPMSRMRRGPALVFYDEDHKNEAHELKEIFIRLRFNPVLCIKISKSLQKKVKTVAESAGLCEDWCIFIAVLATVEEDLIVTPDVCVRVQDVWQPFIPSKCPLLKTKPKLFCFLDAKKSASELEDQLIEQTTSNFVTEEHEFLFLHGVGKSLVTSIFGALFSSLDNPTGIVDILDETISQTEASSDTVAYLHDTLRRNLVFRCNTRSVQYHTDEEAFACDRIALSIPEAASLSCNSISLYKARKFRGAIALMDEVLNISTLKLGADHHETLNIMAWKVELLLGTGKHNQEALQLLDKLIEKRLRFSGDQHFSTLISISNRAFCLHNIGQFTKALELHDIVLEKKYKAIGKDHPFTLTSLHHKAMTLNQLKRHDEALNLENFVLKKMQEVTLGVNHKEILTVKHNKAYTLKCMKHYNEALDLYSEVIDERLKILGAEHPRTLVSMSNKAKCLEECEKYGEAIALLEDLLEKRIRVLGEDHEHTKISAEMLVNLKRIMDLSP